MLAFGIRYLNGFVAAAEPDNRERVEWPPHPGRIFMALAATHFQTGADTAERAALLWLEGVERGGEISAPAIAAQEATHRAIVKHYVPVNDKAGPSKALLHSLPLTRDRQDRVFARAWLEDDRVYMHWPHLDPPAHHRNALAGLCYKVTRIGHPSSLVQMWLAEADEIGEPNWVPDDMRAIVRLRILGPGTLDYLEQQYNAAAVEDYGNLKVTEMQADNLRARRAARNRLREAYGNQPPRQQRPQLSLYQGYARPAQETATASVANTFFSPYLLVLQLGAKQGPYQQLDLVSTLTVTRRWREAILSYSNGLSEPVRRMLSGHDTQGGPSDDPHLAFLPLAFVGHEHADGHLLGMGLALPADVSRDDRREALRAIAAVHELKLGSLGVWTAEPVIASQPPWNLRAEAWTAHSNGATHWSSVTPIVFDRHPKAKNKAQYQQETAAVIAEACTRIGLPKPREVIVTQVSTHLGVPPAFAFPGFRRKDGSQRRHTHAIILFDEPACGPILLGAGRFRGYGAFRPIHEKGER
ncbi:MAG: type I-G CRISPR-associated protein Csb2 [Gammaproteobacteria bacterium]